MSETTHPQLNLPDQKELARRLAAITEKSQKILADFLKNEATSDHYSVIDTQSIMQSFQAMSLKMMENPSALVESQVAFWMDAMALWQKTMERAFIAQPVADPVAQPTPDDKRFKDDAWVNNYLFDFVKQFYLLSSRHTLSAVTKVDGLDEQTARKAAFYTRQFIDAMAPTNFALTNPQVLRATLESGGENLLNGMTHLLEDLERGHGQISLKMTDTSAFKLGENIGSTPGKVVFQNELMQLIQYAPTTEQVFKRPLLVVPPWINKFYIMDLKAKNSLLKWFVDQGHTVFIISWVNPDEKLSHKNFEDYMVEGPLAALEVIGQITGEKDVNAIGYCIGGTLLASTLGYMAAKKDKRIKSATFFTSLIDFSDVGELSVFIDEAQISRLEEHMQKKGYLEGHQMATVFNLLRENDLIWSFVVNNYLLGREPMPFDILYWNSDSTRMPAAMHSFYIRNMYMNNVLRKPGGITLKDTPIDLTKVKVPTYFLSTKEDHIAPWKSTYAGTHILGGENRFVLGGSGHIAGVINPPAANKYCYWTNPALPADADDWLAGAESHPGSWWPNWQEWITPYAGAKVAARQPGGGVVTPLEDAPGSYVKFRLVD